MTKPFNKASEIEGEKNFTFHEFVAQMENEAAGNRLVSGMFLGELDPDFENEGTHGLMCLGRFNKTRGSSPFLMLFQALGHFIRDETEYDKLATIKRCLKKTIDLLEEHEQNVAKPLEEYNPKQVSKLAGKTIKITRGQYKGEEYIVEDWSSRVFGKSWKEMSMDGNIAAIEYAVRGAIDGFPCDDNVYYGKINGLGKLIHAACLMEQHKQEEKRPHDQPVH